MDLTGALAIVKRRFLTIAIFLLAGAVVNVAVAWGCGYYYAANPISLADLPLRELNGSDAQPLVRRHMNLGAPRDYEYTAQTSFGFGWRQRLLTAWHVEEAKFFSSPSHECVVVVICAGWPFLSLQGERHFEPQPVTYRFAWLVQESSVGEWTFIPLRPIWSGFAVNTLFYAAMLWLVIPGPFALRLLIRRRRGLCLACGYDLRHGEHEACPECGVTA